MTDRTEYRGTWWLPSNEEQTVGGIGTISPDPGFKLETFAPLFDDISDNISSTTVDLIYGVSTEGDRIMLRDCLRQSTSITFGDRSSGTNSFLANESYIGDEFLDPLEFDSIELQIQLLEDWLEKSGISFGGDLVGRNTNSSNDFQLTYNRIDPLDISINELTLSIGTTANMNIDRIGGGQINESAYIKISSNESKLGVGDIRELIYSLTYFFAFALREPVQIRDIKGVNKDTMNGKEVNNKIDIRIPFKSGTDVSDKLNPNTVTFYQSDVDNIENIIKSWIACLDDFGNSFYYYLMTFYHDIPLEMKEVLIYAAISEYYMYDTNQYNTQLIEHSQTDPSSLSTHPAFSGAIFTDLDVPIVDAVSHILSKHDSIFDSEMLDFKNHLNQMMDSDNTTSNEKLDTYYFSLAVLEGALSSEIGVSTEQIIANLDARRKGF